jgi:YbgC/YbaW family acyl-CoA thioester hydrolase
MSIKFSRKFRVRHYECDAYRHLNNANYLRYMQETAFDASANVGYDEAKYLSLGTMWLIRETEIEYLRPIYPDQIVNVVTWVEDFRRVRSRRIYEFWLAEKNEMAAKAITDWVYLDRNTSRPIEIPERIVSAFGIDGENVLPKPRPRYMIIRNPPPEAFTQCRKVEWRDIDSAQHVNNAVYLAYFEDIGIKAANKFGWSIERMRHHGFGIIARKHHILYRKSALLDDELEIKTWLSGFKRSTVMRHFVVKRARDKEVLGQSNSTYVVIDVNTNKPIRFPADFRRDFEKNTCLGQGEVDGLKQR